jgi:hypothetical protein
MIPHVATVGSGLRGYAADMSLVHALTCDTCQWITAFATGLYLFAGHQSWRLVNILGAEEDALQAEFRAGKTVWPIYLMFVAVWPVLLGGATAFTVFSRLMQTKN